MSDESSKAQQELTSIRDTVESIWVAIVLAFVLRAFVVEAFVIPTGSMAPRLLGEHLELNCPACGYEYAYGWSNKQDDELHGTGLPLEGGSDDPRKPLGARCPNCSYDRAGASYPSGGDRVLVMKFYYHFHPPDPWDVIVFKNPQDNRQNYIKRLIGLPGETIEILHGDIFVRKAPGEPFRIRRKDDPRVQEAMWQIVFGSDYRPNEQLFAEANRQRAPGEDSLGPPSWVVAEPDRWEKQDPHKRRHRFLGDRTGREARIALDANRPVFLPRYGYNDNSRSVNPRIDIVTDLRLGLVYIPAARDSRVGLTLTSFEYEFRGELGADGVAGLFFRRTDDPPDRPSTLWARTDKLAPLALGRGHKVALTHVDFRVTLWLDGRPVLRSADREPSHPADDRMVYPMDYGILQARLAKENDEVPRPQVRLGASGGPCELKHVALMRDVYYTSPWLDPGPPAGPNGDFARAPGIRKGDPGWGVAGHPLTLDKFPDRPDLDQFFVLGDNSPSSLDGRLWTSAAPTLRLYDDTGKIGSPLLDTTMIQWEPFLLKVKQDALAQGPSPGKQVWAHLIEDVRSRLQSLTAQSVSGVIDENLTAEAVRDLNAMLKDKDLYTPAAWNGLRLSSQAAETARRLAEGKTPHPSELMEFNRQALEAAFPNSILPRRRVYQLGTVPRYSLIGKAVFVYWPAGFRVPGLPRLPVIPNVGRMRLIH